MTLIDCLEIAEDCMLETVGEAIFNVKLHAGNIFSYSEIDKELNELQDDFEKSGLKEDTKVEEALAMLKKS